jgi:hypothetical protein
MARMTVCLTLYFDAMSLWVQRGDGMIQVQPGFGRFLSSQGAAVAVGV